MTYKNLIETIEIIRKYDTLPDCYTIWATYEEFGFEIHRDWNMSAKDIRRLAEMGWGLGSDDELLPRFNNPPEMVLITIQ